MSETKSQKKSLRMIRQKRREKMYRTQLRKYKRLKTRLPMGGFPRKLRVKLKYCETFALNPVAGGIAVQEFRANSLFDPNFTGTGHQPSNYDRLKALYDNYTVTASKIIVTPVQIQNQSNVIGNNPGVLTLHLSEAGGDLLIAHASGGIDNIMEQPRISRSLKPLQSLGTSAPYKWKRKFVAKKFFGVSNIVGIEPYVSDTAGNPDEGAHFEVGYMSPNDTLDPASATFRAEITYYATMTEPKLADAS